MAFRLSQTTSSRAELPKVTCGRPRVPSSAIYVALAPTCTDIIYLYVRYLTLRQGNILLHSTQYLRTELESQSGLQIAVHMLNGARIREAILWTLRSLSNGQRIRIVRLHAGKAPLCACDCQMTASAAV